MTSGIAVFTYNRPNHLSRVLEGLQENNVDHLYIFSDGPKDVDEKDEVNQVREIIYEIDWCQTTVITQDENIGLAESVINGINRVFQDHDRIIVLEDDCVPASNFVSFMQTCLDRYDNLQRVMNINGYSPPIKIPSDYEHDVYFTYRNSSWGWATWKPAWDNFEQDPFSLSELEANSSTIKKICDKAGEDLYPMMKAQLKGQIDSWAIWWSYAIAANNGLCVNPVRSKVRNIGHDDSGTHTTSSNRYDVQLDETPVEEYTFPPQIRVVPKLNKRYNHYISGGYWGKIQRLFSRIR
jgi:hypothetical protein